MRHWAFDAVFYHIYPLGFCGAPARNDFQGPVTTRLERAYDWLEHWQDLGVNAVYLGPVFESSGHGYDTADYYRVDRRLGDNGTLARLVSALHARGMRVILDGVFHHVGRDFWAFRDVVQRGPLSPYCSWFEGLSFGTSSPYGDPFSYATWNGHFELVKLNVQHAAVKAHLFGAVQQWIQDFDIDGLRLDVANSLDLTFQQELALHCRRLRPDFWLMGEVIHGDYRRWVNAETLDSVTNYECYKGLYSSHVDRNYFEIAYALNRQFGENGVYRDLPLYNFADNHDVNRVASNLANPAHLYPLYCLLFTMPGIPAVYYGSEWGIEGRRQHASDTALRPQLELREVAQQSANRDLADAIRRLSSIRRGSIALKQGDYRQLLVRHEQLAFMRQTHSERVVVAVNAAGRAALVEVAVPNGSRLVDLLNQGEGFDVHAGKARIPLPACWGRILAVQ